MDFDELFSFYNLIEANPTMKSTIEQGYDGLIVIVESGGNQFIMTTEDAYSGD